MRLTHWLCLSLAACGAPPPSAPASLPSPPPAPEVRAGLHIEGLGLGRVLEANVAYLLHESIELTGPGWEASAVEVELRPGDARLAGLALPETGVRYALRPDGARVRGEVQGAVVFLDGCGAPRAAPRVVFPGPLGAPGAALVLYDETLPEDLGRLGALTRATPEEAAAWLGRPAHFNWTVEAYVQELSLDADPAPERFVARAQFDPLGTSAASAAEIEHAFLDDQGTILTARQARLSPEELLRFAGQGRWLPYTIPPALVADLDQDGRAEILRANATELSLWGWEGEALRPLPVVYEPACE